LILKKFILFLMLGGAFCYQATAQAITGFWRGKAGKGLFPAKMEVKLILKGDSIAGTSYYYESKNKYIRYSVKGYFNMMDNTVVWWDDQLIENKAFRMPAQLSEADFNCPGEGVMKLDGTAKNMEGDDEVETHLRKMETPVFEDEWDEFISTYTFGSNNPYLIDSVAGIAFNKKRAVAEKQVGLANPVLGPQTVKTKEPQKAAIVLTNPMPANRPSNVLTTQEKFDSRKKELNLEIVVEADSIEINFYDNAEIDGDTISIYLDNRLIYANIRLTDKAFTIKLAREQLLTVSELVMVAENLGSIPPNTSYMYAMAGEKKYEAFLASTAHSSALIRLHKSVQQ
jgi:hypothetical protein